MRERGCDVDSDMSASALGALFAEPSRDNPFADSKFGRHADDDNLSSRVLEHLPVKRTSLVCHARGRI